MAILANSNHQHKGIEGTKKKKKFPAFHGNRIFVAVMKSVCRASIF